jgi:hypothetical protein
MTIKLRAGILLLMGAQGLGCNGSGSSSEPFVPSSYTPPAPTLVVFTDRASGFSTSDVRDVEEEILQFNTAGELIWTADDTRLPGYQVGQDGWGNLQYWVAGKICPEGCAFVIRFGTRDGERRAYLTVDYGHNNPGTLVDVEVNDGALLVAQSQVYPPGTPTLSGVVTEMTPTERAPVQGALVYRGVQGGWQEATTDRNGFYKIQGLYDGSSEVVVYKDGFQTNTRNASIEGDTRLDIELVRR